MLNYQVAKIYVRLTQGLCKDCVGFAIVFCFRIIHSKDFQFPPLNLHLHAKKGFACHGIFGDWVKIISTNFRRLSALGGSL